MTIPKLMSPRRAAKILAGLEDTIGAAGRKYKVPAAAIKAVMYKEMTEMDLMDPVADLAAMAGFFGKHDSSTGYGQIFGHVGIKAVNFAVSRGLARSADLGLPEDRVLSPERREDVKLFWRMLRKDRKKNIEILALNLLSCADEMAGTVELDTLTKEEWLLTFTRYNADVKTVTRYGEDVFRLYREFGGTVSAGHPEEEVVR